MTDIDAVILQLEAQQFRSIGAKEAAIREATGLTATRYYQRLNQLLDDPSAIATAPVTVKRLRRIRASHRA